MIGYNENSEKPDMDRDKWIDSIKNVVATDGSCVIDTPWFSEGVKEYGTDGKYNTYVFKDVYSALFEGGSGHSLQIIGWDDNFSRDNFVATDIYKEYAKDKETYVNNNLENVREAFDCWQHFDKGEDAILVKLRISYIQRNLYHQINMTVCIIMMVVHLQLDLRWLN